MIALKLLGALGLMVYGMRLMSESLQKIAGPQLRHILAKMTTNRISGILTGAFVTSVVQSSSATTVMTVSFVSAGLLTLAQAIAVIMGANIGTTLTAWIMSLGYSADLSSIVFPSFFIGVILLYQKRRRYVGEFLFGIAFLFLSLVMLSASGKEMDLEHNSQVVNFFANFDTSSHFTIIAFVAIGTVLTCILQSSAALMAITIMLCTTGVLPIHLGIALVMGENIGTTATANLAALGAGIQARRAALSHLVFNVFGVLWVLMVFYPLVDLVCNIAGYTGNADSQRLSVVLATFHTCFNVTNTAIMVFFIPKIETLVCKILPSKNEQEDVFRLQYIKSHLVETPEIAVLQAQKETTRFAESVRDMFVKEIELLDNDNSKHFDKQFASIERMEDSSDRVEVEIAHYLEQVSDGHLSDETKQKIRSMIRIIGELESISDSCYNLARIINRGKNMKRNFSGDQIVDLKALTALCNNALDQMCVVMADHSGTKDIKETFRIENEINKLRDNLKAKNIDNINEHRYDYTIGIMFSDYVSELEKIGDYIVNVMQARFGK